MMNILCVEIFVITFRFRKMTFAFFINIYTRISIMKIAKHDRDTSNDNKKKKKNNHYNRIGIDYWDGKCKKNKQIMNTSDIIKSMKNFL